MTAIAHAQWQSRAEVARKVRVTDRTLRRWEKAGIGPTAHRLGPRTVRYLASEVDAWIKSSAQVTA